MRRTCKSCSEPLPGKATNRRLYCSVKCKNRGQIQMRVAYTTRWRKANPKLVVVQRQSYRDKQAENMRRYYQKNPAVFLNHRHLRRARSRLTGGAGVSSRDWLRLLRRYLNRCAYCGSSDTLTVDHIVPISRGGQHSNGNVLPACRPCNTSKSDRLLIEWRVWRAARAA